MDKIYGFGLGRKKIVDERDLLFPIKTILPKQATETSKYWYDEGWWGNQGSTPQCVGYSWAHWLEDGPIEQPGTAPIVAPLEIYTQAQKIDEWTGENYDGTSVRAGAKVLVSKGFISEYRWAFDLATLVNAVLTVGPVVVGTNWYSNMFYPDAQYVIKIGGYVAGGHAYVINGVDTIKKQFRIKNSWGRAWGLSGHAYISFDDMSRLIREGGEVCLALEKSSSVNTTSTSTTTTRTTSTTTTTTKKPTTTTTTTKRPTSTTTSTTRRRVISDAIQRLLDEAQAIRDRLMKKQTKK